jgi:hypothetical protein
MSAMLRQVTRSGCPYHRTCHFPECGPNCGPYHASVVCILASLAEPDGATIEAIMNVLDPEGMWPINARKFAIIAWAAGIAAIRGDG